MEVRETIPDATHRTSRSFVLAMLALAGLYLACLPLRDFWYPDEPDMAEITRQMALTGDALQLWLFQRPFDDYPPLFFWITQGVARLAGCSEFVLRLPTALSALSLLALVGGFVRRRFGAEFATSCVLLLGTSYLFLWQAINMHLDMLLAVAVVGAIVALDALRDASTRRARVAAIAIAGVAMGAGALTKGPIGILLPCAIVGLDALLARNYRRLAPIAVAAAIGTALFGAWALTFAAEVSGEGITYFLASQNLERFLGGRSHDRPIYYYVTNLLVDLLPWSLLLVPAVIEGWRRARQGDAASRLLLVWLGFGFVFFSLSASKRSVYLLPVIPAAAILVGLCLHRLATSSAVSGRLARSQAYVVAGSLAVLALAALIGIPIVEFALPGALTHEIALAIAVPLFAAPAWLAWRRLRAMPAERVLPALPWLVMPAYLAIYGVLYPTLDEPISAKPDARWLVTSAPRSLGHGAALAFFDEDQDDMPKESSALSFYGRFPIEVVTTREQIEDYFRRNDDGVLLVEDNDDEDLEALGLDLPQSERQVTIGDDRFLVLRAR
jgi:4-amino-4-deoxy-L-arabinose transferase-like glycosyltransferase